MHFALFNYRYLNIICPVEADFQQIRQIHFRLFYSIVNFFIKSLSGIAKPEYESRLKRDFLSS